ncbi:MAG: hypothetical protein GQ534_01755, partial [Candidatus Delongbacteria bacterium]|nr:hypothetical protein [Candidatus Delongbacteria bacterium]
ENYNYQIFPDPLEVNNVIAPFWSDLDLSSSGHIFHYYDETEKSFTVQYDNAPMYSEPDIIYTFQVILYENGKIKFQYADIEDLDDYYVIGIENSNGTIGTLIADSTPYLKNGMAIELIPWVLLDSYSGELTAGMSKTIDVKFDARILNVGVYLNDIVISSNDISEPIIYIPVDLIVLGGLGIPENITTEVIDTEVTITWDAISGADSYSIYASVKPYSDFQDLTGFGAFNSETEWTVPYAGQKMFFYVVSSSDEIKSSKIENVTDEMILEYLTR